jgi:hypothetical protein
MKYRRKLVEMKLHAINTSSLLPDLDVLFACNKIWESWNSISSLTIKNFFKHSGFIKSNKDINNKDDKGDDSEKEIDTEKDDIKNESILLDKLKDKVNFDIYKYISIDDKLSSYNTLTVFYSVFCERKFNANYSGY